MGSASRERIRPALLAALAASGAALLACGSVPSGPVQNLSCGSSAPVSGCTLLLSGTRQENWIAMSNGCQVSVSAAGGATSITFSTSGGTSAPYPQLAGSVVLNGAPASGQSYSADQLASANLSAVTDPNSTWAAVAGPGGPVGDVALAVDSFASSGSSGTLHGALSAMLVGRTVAGVVSLCVVF